MRPLPPLWWSKSVKLPSDVKIQKIIKLAIVRNWSMHVKNFSFLINLVPLAANRRSFFKYWTLLVKYNLDCFSYVLVFTGEKNWKLRKNRKNTILVWAPEKCLSPSPFFQDAYIFVA